MYSTNHKPRALENYVVPLHKMADAAPLWPIEGRYLVGSRVLYIHSALSDTFESISGALTERGYNVTTRAATTGLTQLLGEAQQSDLVIMDIQSDDPNMLDSFDWLRQRWLGPVMILTGALANPEVVRLYQTGADAYLPHPCNVRVLVARAEALIRRSKGLLRR